jgi:hypothetical protein
MYSYEEGLKVAPEVTLVYHEDPEGEATRAAPSVTEEASGS